MQEAPEMRFPTTAMSAATIILAAGPIAIGRDADEPPRIDRVLARWEALASARKTIDVRFTREDHSRVWNDRTEYDGRLILKDAETAAVDLMKRGDPPVLVERLVWTGSELRYFDAKRKQIWFFARPRDIPPKLPDSIGLPFLFGRKAAELKRDYDIRLMKEDEKSYLIRFDAKDVVASPSPLKGDLFARMAWSMPTFHAVHVELDKETLLPRQVLLVDPNGKDTQTYRVTAIRLDEPVREDIFQARAVKGWKVVENPAPAGSPDHR
jgi:hypothetical protein